MAKKEITDFGSKIGGARKDVWVKRGLCVEDIKDMTASEKEKYIKRDYIWPKPDIQEELEKGFSRFIVYWHNEMRKTVTSKKNIYILKKFIAVKDISKRSNILISTSIFFP